MTRRGVNWTRSSDWIAQEIGRTGYAVYDAATSPMDTGKLTIVTERRRAIENDELVLHYQPKADLESGEVTSVEALVRWEHPERGLIPPDDFIPVAQQRTLVKHSSLEYLKRLPVNEIKIDRSFVTRMLESEDDGIIVRSTIHLARNLGLTNPPPASARSTETTPRPPRPTWPSVLRRSPASRAGSPRPSAGRPARGRRP